MRADPSGLSDEDEDLGDDSNFTSAGQLYARAAVSFAKDPMWRDGSCQRKEFSSAISNIPAVGVANNAIIALSGHDYIAGHDASPLQRGSATDASRVHGSK